MTNQSRSAAEDESRDGRQIGKLLHHDQFSVSDVFNLGLEGRLPGVELQDLEGTKRWLRPFPKFVLFFFYHLAI